MSELQEFLVRHEGIRLKPYQCPAGKLTIGVGRNIEDAGISMSEALLLLANDIEWATADAKDFPWFEGLNQPRKDVIISMIFNMGAPTFSNFKRTIQLISKQKFEEAAIEMLASKWAAQVGPRAIELSEMMRAGEYPTKVG